MSRKRKTYQIRQDNDIILVTRNQLYKIRYHALRLLGYSSKEASRLRSRKDIDISRIRINKNGEISKWLLNKKAKLNHTKKIVNSYLKWARNVENDTIYTKWGMLTHDKRYRDKLKKVAKTMENNFKNFYGPGKGLSNDQIYYFLYFAVQGEYTYEETANQLLTSKEFEIYDKRKQLRQVAGFYKRKR